MLVVDVYVYVCSDRHFISQCTSLHHDIEDDGGIVSDNDGSAIDYIYLYQCQ
jgi:hypothetical protein